MSHGSESSEEPLWVVVGPTASGKTEFAIALAERIGGEVIGADSVQVYREFDIGTGKPTDEQRNRVPYHWVDVLDPLESIDAAAWAENAHRLVLDLRSRARGVVVCGGSFLWVKALLFGLLPAPPADPLLRAEHRAEAEAKGRPALHARLVEVDPPLAARLAPNDLVRVSRALEVFELTGVRLSEWQAQHGFRQARHQFRLLGLRRDSEELDQRIRDRTQAMLDSGWVEEVCRLQQAGYANARAMGSVGYRQVAAALEAGAAGAMSELATSITRATRVFARRQRTWLRDQPVQWLPDTPEALDRLLTDASP